VSRAACREAKDLKAASPIKKGVNMFRYCYVHKGYFGIKKPLLNLSVTGGICKRCLPGELEKLRKWKEKKAWRRESAPPPTK